MAEDDTDNSRKFEFHATRKWLFVKLNRPLVEVILQLIQSRSEIAELTDIKPEDVSEIYISDGSRSGRASNTPKRWRDRFALFGCAIIGFLIMVVFVAGISAIIEQIRGHH